MTQLLDLIVVFTAVAIVVCVVCGFLSLIFVATHPSRFLSCALIQYILENLFKGFLFC